MHHSSKGLLKNEVAFLNLKKSEKKKRVGKSLDESNQKKLFFFFYRTEYKMKKAQILSKRYMCTGLYQVLDCYWR